MRDSNIPRFYVIIDMVIYMDKRELKRKCFLEALEESVIHVEMVMNQLKKIDDKKGFFDEDVIYKDTVKTTLDLELSLVSACIILRKMSENLYITIPNDLRRDLNSIIHSNRFDYDDMLVVYSQRGREEIDLDSLLHFCRTVLSFDKVHS